ncbi:MAG: cell division protein FtsZ [archaeon]
MDDIIKGVLDREDELDKKIERKLAPKSGSRHHDIDAELKQLIENKFVDITIVGCGGAGNNTVNRLSQIGIVGAKVIAVNTDAQDLLESYADEKILLGEQVTKGLGAGSDPRLGEEAARESKMAIHKAIGKSNMVFITCGLGGGTGTGTAPVVAEVSKSLGALTIAIVTLPFEMEGNNRHMNARGGLEKLEKLVDTLIIIPNEKLLEIVPDLPIDQAFRVADEILVGAMKGMTELITKPGLINLDFADVRSVMCDGGMSMIGIGYDDSNKRVENAVYKALNNPLLSVDIQDATGALINVTGGPDLTLKESETIVNLIRKNLSDDAKIIWGASITQNLKAPLEVMVVVTGIKQSVADIYADIRKNVTPHRSVTVSGLGIDMF